MKLYAISDLHLGYEINQQISQALPAQPAATTPNSAFKKPKMVSLLFLSTIFRFGET
jgi:hypothetical protein